MKLLIEVHFPVDAMTDRRRREIQQVIQELKETLEVYNGTVVRADLVK